jgi:hypothetical protein
MPVKYPDVNIFSRIAPKRSFALRLVALQPIGKSLIYIVSRLFGVFERALKGLRANRCTIAASRRNLTLLEYGIFAEPTSQVELLPCAAHRIQNPAPPSESFVRLVRRLICLTQNGDKRKTMEAIVSLVLGRGPV